MSKIKANEIMAQLESMIENFQTPVDLAHIGYVISVCDGIARVRGLTNAKYGECIIFENGVKGMVMELNTAFLSAVLLDINTNVSEGSQVQGTGKTLTTQMSMDLIGRMSDPFGNPLDQGPLLTDVVHLPIERNAPGVLERKSIDQPCPTGIKIIDAFIPIGKGQREMIIGDRLTGKTSLAIDMIINQKKLREQGEKIYCIYVAIGQQAAKIAKVKAILEEHDAMEYTIIVGTTSSDPASWQVLAPFTGCAMGEYFRDKGMHALVIYDDLSKHAVAHRHISLLLRNPPGREAYPGDIFYLHSRLLERAAKLNDALGGGSLTAIPIVEILEGNYATYVPTNIWSITDGQIVLRTDMFLEGQRPAIDIGLSVSRVGGAAQIPAMKSCIELKLILAQYNEYKNFTKYGAEIDQSTKIMLDTGNSLMHALKQKNLDVKSTAEQAVFFQACLKGKLNGLTEMQIQLFEQKLCESLSMENSNIIDIINKDKKIDINLDMQIDELLDHTIEKIVNQQ